MEEAKFFISQSSGGSENEGYEVIDYDFQSERELDKRGAPGSKLKSFIIGVEIYSSKSKSDMLGRMFNQYEKVKGRIDFYGNDSGSRKKYKTVKFENAHIFSYSENFVKNQQRRLTERISITAGKVDVEGVSYSQNWED